MMTSKHRITCIAISAAVALKFLAGTANASVESMPAPDGAGMSLTVLHDASGRPDGAQYYAGRFIFRQGNGSTPIGRGLDIARVDGEIV
jgi:hypothetical protein